MSANIPVSFPDQDAAEVKALAKATGLAQQDVIRQSSRLGRPLLREQLARKSGRVTNVEPLPAHVLREIYPRPERDEAGVERLMRRQPKGVRDSVRL